MVSRYYINRTLLLCGFVGSLLVFWFGCEWFDIPVERGFDVSLLHQPSAVIVMVVIAALLGVATMLSTLIAGRVRADAGLFCAALGMMVVSLRGGRIFYTLAGARPSVFTSLAVEIVLLFAAMLAAWLLVRKAADVGLTRGDDPDFQRDEELSFDQKFLATATHACAMIVLMSILCRTDQKVQALASVGVSSLLASMVATMVAPTTPGVWYWMSPLAVGLLGYVWASFSPQGLGLGQPAGYFAMLARPLPLDYASTGVAGAMLGYWFARSWHRERHPLEAQAAPHAGDSPPTLT
jgi:hypothetical protein